MVTYKIITLPKSLCIWIMKHNCILRPELFGCVYLKLANKINVLAWVPPEKAFPEVIYLGIDPKSRNNEQGSKNRKKEKMK